MTQACGGAAAPSAAPAGNGVLAVVVVHERRWSAVRAAATLSAWIEPPDIEPAAAQLTLRQVLVYDNSRIPVARPPLGHRFLYEHAPVNGGTRAAYERAVSIAQGERIDWILLLDQDTELPLQYLHVASATMRPSTVVMVPTLVSSKRIVSPGRFTRLGRVVLDARGDEIQPHDRVATAGRARHGEALLAPMASAALIRTSALQGIRELPPQLWLDYVDHALFFRLQQQGARIEPMPLRLEHEASMSSVARIPLERLAGIWRAERVFVDGFGPLASAVRRVRLLMRVIRISVSHPTRAADAWRARRAVDRPGLATRPDS